jgi:L-ascorbate metabolism protein UlaG (beta-lactamase superfamily)
LLLPHLGGVGGDGDLGLRTMNSEEAVSLVRLVDPKLVVPIHHTTFAHYREPIEALEQRADEAGLGPRFDFPTEGKSISLP